MEIIPVRPGTQKSPKEESVGSLSLSVLAAILQVNLG